MIAADHDLIGQILHQPSTAYPYPRGSSMRGLGELAELAAEVFADRLHPETDAEDRQFFLERRANRSGDREIRRPARAGGQHQEIPVLLFEHVERMNVSDHGDNRADLTKIIRQHMDETVVVIDQK